MFSMMALFFAFLSCIGLTYPNGAALALAPFHRDAGRASALLGFLQTGTGAAISMAIGFLGVRAVIALLSGTSATALIMLFASKPFLGKPIEADATDAIVIH
jgi:DHA1 family bicyclomycin/chloramphenicol resistance-like MFS transporter